MSGNLKYVNIRIVSTRINWKCVGVTHEYWDSNPGCKKELIDDSKLYIMDVGDGGCKADKFPRDIRLLTKGLEEETNKSLRTRYKFYLAQSYKDSGKPEKAIEWYQRRIDAESWEEENWYAHYMIGTCYLRMYTKANREAEILDKVKDRTEEQQQRFQKVKKEADEYEAHGIRWMNIAFNRRPWRVEPVMLLSKHYREKGMNGISYMYAKTAMDPYCQLGLKDRLFVEHKMYNILPLFEISITAFYINRFKEGYDACQKLLYLKDIPTNIKNRTKANLEWYEKRLALKTSK